MRRATTSFGMLSGTLLLLAVLGCGGGSHQLETARISGKVTLDGKPLGEGTVVFLPKAGRPARGDVAEDGSFTLGTYSTSDGAVLGMHRVTVTAKRQDTETYFESVRPPGKDFIEWIAPERYSGPNSSGLTFEVISGGSSDVLFELTTKP